MVAHPDSGTTGNLGVFPASIPEILKERQQWVMWRRIIRNGEPTKPPYQLEPIHKDPKGKPLNEPILASTTDSTTWGPFEFAYEIYDGNGYGPSGYDGIGFVFSSGDPYAGIDLDKCRNPETGDIKPWAQEIIDGFSGYVEVSPSGTGIHIIVRGKVKDALKKKLPEVGGEIEIYSQERYFTITGVPYDFDEDRGYVAPEFPDQQKELNALLKKYRPPKEGASSGGDQRNSRGDIPDELIIAKAKKAKNGAKFSQLMDGNLDDYDGDHSAADHAFVFMLWFWTQDEDQIRRIHESSGLSRDKSTDREDYLERSLRAAAESGMETYDWPSRNGTNDTNFDSSDYEERGSDETNSEGKPLPLKTGSEIASSTPEETEWIAYPWFAKGTITEVSGAIKRAGKTTWLAAGVSKILRGQQFLGGKTKRTAVVFLTEQAPNSFRRVISAANLERDDFHVFCWQDVRDYGWEELIAEVMAAAKRLGAELIVIDVLSRWASFPGVDESTPEYANRVMPALKKACAEGFTIVYARHDRKAGGHVGESGRGSSQIAGDADQLIQLRRGDGNARPTIRVIEAVGRFGDDTPDTLIIELVDGEYVSRGDASAYATQQAEVAIREVLPATAEEAIDSKEVVDRAEKLGATRTAITDALKRMREAHDIQHVGTGKRGDPYRYYQLVSSEPPPYRPDESNSDGAEGGDPPKVDKECDHLRGRELDDEDWWVCKGCGQRLYSGKASETVDPDECDHPDYALYRFDNSDVGCGKCDTVQPQLNHKIEAPARRMGSIKKLRSYTPEEFRKKFPPLDRSEALPANDLSWQVLLREEPRLADLEKTVLELCEKSKDWHTFCEEVAFKGNLGDGTSVSSRVEDLAGFQADNPKLRSEAAYKIAHGHLFNLVPHCRRCEMHTGPLYPPHPDALEEPTWADLCNTDDRFEELMMHARELADYFVGVLIPSWREQCGDDEERFIWTLHDKFWDVRGQTAVPIEDYCVAHPTLSSDEAHMVGMTAIYGYFRQRVMEGVIATKNGHGSI